MIKNSMPENKLDFFQIYYKENQRHDIYDFAIPYCNSLATPYLENDIIASLVPSSKADLIAVTSWRLKQKRKSISSLETLKASGGVDLSKEKILTTEFDVAVLTPRPLEHKMLFMAQHWHGRVWVDSFSVLAAYLHKDLGIEVPDELKYPIYGNHFIAKKEIYNEYVLNCLVPVIKYMEESNNVFFQDAGYRSHKERMGDHETVVDYETTTSRRDWPIGVFILERLFSIWLNGKKLNIINL